VKAAIVARIVSMCAYCGCTTGPFHYDHVVPRSRGGPDTPRNLVQACALCNREKRDRLPSEWLSEVPAAVAAIESRVVSEVGGRIKAKREWNANNRRKGARSAGTHFCYFCGGTVSVRDGFLTFYDQEAGPPFKAPTGVRFLQNGGREEFGELAYPGNGEDLVRRGRWRDLLIRAVLCHQACGPDIGYWLDLERVRREHAELRRHCFRKRWAFLELNDAFDMAVAAAGGTT
jgi:hypothetical protein